MAFIAPVVAWAAANAATIGAVTSAAGAVMGGIAAKQQGDYQNKIAKQNAELATAKARDAERMGSYERDQIRLEYGQKQARGELASAAGNVALGTGTPLTWGEDLAMARGYDLSISQQNADRQAAGFESERRNFLAEGAAAKAKGNSAFTGSLFKAGGTLLGESESINNIFKKKK